MECSSITAVILHYYPQWEPPADKRTWNACLCPAHDEDNPSCAVSYTHNAVKCLACGFQGDVVSIVRRKEGCSYQAAIRKAAELTEGCGGPVRKPARRKPGRPLFN